MKMSIEERVKALEKKILVLEGSNPLKAKPDLGLGNPYESLGKPGKEVEATERQNG
jgi:hypothetical protein